MSTLDIVMPVLNEGDSLARRLHALQPLRARGARVVVVDGGSNDASWAIARRQADAVVASPRGRAVQMNAGARSGSADVVLFLHADTALPDDADARVADALQRGFDWGRFDVRIDSTHPVLGVVAAAMNLRSRLTGIATGDQALFVRRRLFERLGGFAEVPLMEDIDLSARLKAVGPPACLHARVVTSARRWEQYGVWRTIGLMWRLRAAYALGASPQNLALRYGYRAAPAVAPAHVAVLAKAPVAGLAKTRLIPRLGAAGAARAQRRFARDTVHLAQSAALGPVTVWCAPDESHRFFRALHQTLGVACLAQPGGDLGHRMGRACQHHVQADPGLPVLLVGTDCAVLGPGHLQEAARALLAHDVVLVPAEDGGYVLLGMRRWVPEVFRDIAWSTPAVLAQTRERLQAAGVRWHEMAPLWDVDEPADWDRLQVLGTLQEQRT